MEMDIMGFEKRIYNFSAGPSMLPLEVLKKVQDEMLNYGGSGMSVMEMSHRSKAYGGIIGDAEASLRRLMGIPDGYKVLFLQGGATLQFAMIPLNLMRGSGKADYIVTGSWAEKAAKEGKKFGDAVVVASSADKNFTYIPRLSKEDFRQDADYVHITLNNTIYGSKYPYIPDTGDVPLVCDWSSGILSEEIDVSRFGLIYAGAQKNIAPAGLTIVIIREDLIGKAPASAPTYMDYSVHAANGSMYNTPPAFTVYVAGEVFKHLLAGGGVAAQEKRNRAKAERLYSYIDGSRLYSAPVERESRSLMNVVFVTGDEALDKKFVAQAREEGLADLNGHRSIGGMRASIYNAMPDEGIDALIAFMKKFEVEAGR
ncbi:MAG: 3-phosphoserine/phosphohydroxythreonine transaminase [Clostridiales Family XIII bacterium]|jgi:phosphoserine aminotransferase|nr:3-phosphoserine/phosphohydroxythreonine transaminase [Clostridiales Family XIII bacterium]